MSDQPRDTIESLLKEKRIFPPPAEFAARAQIQQAEYQRLMTLAQADYERFWAEQARAELQWMQPFTEVLNSDNAPHYQWFADGLLNVSANCIDRHLPERSAQTAILFEGEPGDIRRITYGELLVEVSRFANALRSRGIKKGDRVVLYMPMVPEAVIAMQACARIGAIHSVVFGGFSGDSLRERIIDAEAAAVVTADGGYRGGRVIELKAVCDRVLGACPSVHTVFVLRRAGNQVDWNAGRDVWWHEITAQVSAHCPPVTLGAEHPLFLLYTSGSTGRPKGIQHSSAGYLLGTILTMRWVFDIRPDDVFWCTADVGWITGHSYVAYGPLAAGTTLLMYEGGPMFPDAGRYWQICERHKVSVFYTAPTAIRALKKQGDEYPARHDLSALRLLGSVGEPINPEAWMWYHSHIGHDRCPIVDTWWQTETGIHMIAPVPGVSTLKPGSCGRPLPGIMADIVDNQGEPVAEPDKGGLLVITRPWPSMLRTVWRDPGRYIDTYWKTFGNRYYISGDGARRDADGYYWVMGRVDDVLKVSGHRLGTMEIESALVAHPRVAEAAVVGRPDDVTGEAICAFVVTRGTRPVGADAQALTQELRQWVGEHIGPIARPAAIRYADNLPKTRSGKIMRRILRAVAAGHPVTEDTSTLENPDIIRQLQGD